MNLKDMVIATFSKRPGKICWRSQDGTMTPIKEMNDRHLQNAHALLVSDPTDVRAALLPALEQEIKERGLRVGQFKRVEEDFHVQNEKLGYR